jgi:hypothetical protein
MPTTLTRRWSQFEFQPRFLASVERQPTISKVAPMAKTITRARPQTRSARKGRFFKVQICSRIGPVAVSDTAYR